MEQMLGVNEKTLTGRTPTTGWAAASSTSSGPARGLPFGRNYIIFFCHFPLNFVGKSLKIRKKPPKII
jgi:hypothetical protein